MNEDEQGLPERGERRDSLKKPNVMDRGEEEARKQEKRCTLCTVFVLL